MFGYASESRACGGPAAVRGAVVDDPEHPPCRSVRFSGHDLVDKGAERFDAGAGCAVADHLGAVHVVGGQVGQRAVAAVSFDAHRRAGPGGGWDGPGCGPARRASRRR